MQLSSCHPAEVFVKRCGWGWLAASAAADKHKLAITLTVDYHNLTGINIWCANLFIE